jgi:23S rRNA (pseudouridine1915-N3)-methyltransferase
MIKILAIGRKHEAWVTDGLERYQKRLQKPWDVEWVLLPHSARDGAQARQEESSALLSRLKPDDFVILLDERGKALDSPALSQLVARQLDTSKPIVFVIGGAYGVDERLSARADLVWSLSPLVFPHQLVRLILTEQLYRAQAIAQNHPYHHE